ncbi:hypothetical protein JVT61DRAFT_11851 [Boletus reticuloceps]|uniref:Uncharacterized protein n=1 Tax=Boletus reticuloceps TaxID=495285 RepID=A0A8I3AEG7_9AGAM|nr:hypothetical protein JVT61DRAFT_11851 [Boletus reticuloceps]
MGSVCGLETPGNKLFIRASVITLDALIYVPALYAFTQIWYATRSSRVHLDNSMLHLYSFIPHFCSSTSGTSDIIRLCLVRKSHHAYYKV